MDASQEHKEGRLVGAGLMGVAIAGALGEGVTAGAALVLWLAVVRSPQRSVVWHAARPFLFLLFIAAASVWAARQGPFGFRLSALGPMAPWLMLPLAAAAASCAGAKATERAALVFTTLVLAGGVIALAFGMFHIDVHALWHRASELRGHRQAFAPGTQRVGVGGWYGHRLKLASALLLTSHLALASLCVRARQPLRLRRQGVSGCALALSFFLLVQTGTRAHVLAWFFGVGGMTVTVCCRRFSSKVTCAILLVLLAMGGTAISYGMQNYSSSRAGVSERWPLWRCGIDIVRAYPFGVGIGNEREAMALCLAQQAPLTRSPRTGPHHSVLGLWMRAGGFGVALWALWAAQLLARSVRGVRHADASAAEFAAAVCSGGLLSSFAFVGLWHDALHHAVTAWTFFWIVGLCIAWLPPLARADK